MELATITIPKADYDLLNDSGLLPDHKLKEIYVKDNMFDNDEIHKVLKKAARKAYTALREYEFKKRNP